MMKRQWANHLVKEDFQDKLEKIQRKRIKETNDDEDSDGQPILTKLQQLSRQEAIKILDTILKDIRGDKVTADLEGAYQSVYFNDTKEMGEALNKVSPSFCLAKWFIVQQTEFN